MIFLKQLQLNAASITVISISVVLGFLGGVFYDSSVVLRDFTELRDNIASSDFKFINPLLECGDFQNISNSAINKMKKDVLAVIARHKNAGDMSAVSVYFRDLNNGPWMGIDEKAQFSPSSLLKVPLMMSFFKLAESQPDILNKSVAYESNPDETLQYFKPEKSPKIGELYSVEGLIETMIEHSDNNATRLLWQLIDSTHVADSYRELGIGVPDSASYTISVKTYASFFRILFNATFLNRYFSEKALAILAKSSFSEGIRAAVPSEIVVAHKFGERIVDSETDEKQLHDCGIVYFPKLPYLICVMSRGHDFSKLAAVIKDISAIIYKDFIKNPS